MKYGSVCSGVEAATMAWHPLGWEAQWFSEIEPFPSAVLQHHYPNIPNLGDMTLIHSNPIFNETTIDVLVGGTPCQSFSVAGLRKGLEDPRGNLMLTFLSLIDKKKPKWIIWENVPGVLSTNKGEDFKCFLDGLEEIGYICDIDILDAQFFGVPQRRRRVFVCGQNREDLLNSKTSSSALTILQCLVEILHGIYREMLPLLEKEPLKLESQNLSKDGVLRRMKLFEIATEKCNYKMLQNLLTEVFRKYPLEAKYLVSKPGENKEAVITVEDLLMGSMDQSQFTLTEESLKTSLEDLYEVMKSYTMSTLTNQITQNKIYTFSQIGQVIGRLICRLSESSPRSSKAVLSFLTLQQEITNYARQTNSNLFEQLEGIYSWGDIISETKYFNELIGYFGTREHIISFLFESESLCRNIAESRSKREKVTREIEGSPITYRKSSRATTKDGLETWVEDDVSNTLNCFDVGDVRSTVSVVENGSWWDGGQTAASLITRCHDQYMPDKGNFSAVLQKKGTKWLPPNDSETVGSLLARDYKGMGNQDLTDGRGLVVSEKGIAVDMYNMTINEKTSQTLSSSASDINHTGGTITNARVRRLTPVECERLQGFPEIKKYTIFDVCLDHQNNYVNVAIKCRKLQNNVFNAEEVRKQELAKYAVQNLNAEKENQKSVVVLNVQNNYGPKLTNLFNVEKLLSNAISAETKKKFLQLMETESFAQLLVDISTIAEKIIETGKVELQVNPLNFTWGESGNLFAEIFGQEKEGFAKDVESIAKEAITFITLNLDQNIRNLNMKNLTWLFSVLAAINLFIAEKTLSQSSFEFCITTQNGFTNIPYRKKPESPDGPRYKAMGNSMAVPVMAWIGKRIQEVSEIINQQNNVEKK